jgi:hypothetical protein
VASSWYKKADKMMTNKIRWAKAVPGAADIERPNQAV